MRFSAPLLLLINRSTQLPEYPAFRWGQDIQEAGWKPLFNSVGEKALSYTHRLKTHKTAFPIRIKGKWDTEMAVVRFLQNPMKDQSHPLHRSVQYHNTSHAPPAQTRNQSVYVPGAWAWEEALEAVRQEGYPLPLEKRLYPKAAAAFFHACASFFSHPFPGVLQPVPFFSACVCPASAAFLRSRHYTGRFLPE